MNNYWKNHYNLISKQFDGSLLKQVGKTVNGLEISEVQVNLIVENIANILQLTIKDSLVDLCCGNGIITKQLAPLVNDVVGIDFTAGLIDAAINYNSFQNIKYINSDVLLLNLKYFSGMKKVLMYEALQHFSQKQFAILLNKLSNLDDGSLVFFASIPNKEKLREYYNTDEKFSFYVQRENQGVPHIGQWWLMDEIETLAIASGFKVTLIPQESKLYTAYYRFNVLLEKS